MVRSLADRTFQPRSKLQRCYLGLGWTGGGKWNDSPGADVDASCLAFTDQARATQVAKETIFYMNLKNQAKTIAHTGDVITPEQNWDGGDMEKIYVWLTKLDPGIDTLVFTVNVFTEGVDFADLTEAYVRIVNADTEQEFGRLRLAGGGLKGNAVIFAKLYRGKPNEPWQLLAIGKPETLPGMSSAQEMVPHIHQSGMSKDTIE